MNSKFKGTEEEFVKMIAELREEFGPFTGAFKVGDAFEVTADGVHETDVKAGDIGIIASVAYADDLHTDGVAYCVVMEEPRDIDVALMGLFQGYHYHLGEKSMRKVTESV